MLGRKTLRRYGAQPLQLSGTPDYSGMTSIALTEG